MTTELGGPTGATNGDEDFAAPQQVCDLIMQGGITSGVVFPSAITELAKKYRFSSIGGASAGAMAAAVAAAAEYGRASGGFGRLNQIPPLLATDLASFFQPAPKLKTLFEMGLASNAAKTRGARVLAAVKVAAAGYWSNALSGSLVGAAIAVVGLLRSDWALFLLGIFLTLLGAAVGIVLGLKHTLTVDIAENGFGLCSGATQDGYSTKGLTDWLAEKIDWIAGKPLNTSPLTFGDLTNRRDAPPINLAMMTTNLMMGRPHQLPMKERTFLFREEEFAKLLPAYVLNYLIANTTIASGVTGPNGEVYRHFPDPDHLPLVLAARLSLSFPVLFSTIPLYAIDYTLKSTEPRVPRLCRFSDGGISSNFPIHFFDRLWPNTPTFGIALEDFDESRNTEPPRAWMPKSARSGISLPIRPVDGGLVDLLLRMVFTAKDWQDNLQSTLPGYRERIVHIPLKPNEGGLNLGMNTAVIQGLIGFGKEAGEIAAAQFDLPDHRWRRFLVAMARVEETLDDLAEAYDSAPFGGQSFKELLASYSSSPRSYEQVDPTHLATLLNRAEELVVLGRRWRSTPTIRQCRIPKPETDLRITPKP